MKALMAGIILVSLASVASASDQEDRSGNALLSECTQALNLVDAHRSAGGKEAMAFGMCFGKIRGSADVFFFFASTVEHPRKTTGQLVRIVVKFLNDHPADLDQDETTLIVGALSEAFPVLK